MGTHGRWPPKALQSAVCTVLTHPPPHRFLGGWLGGEFVLACERLMEPKALHCPSLRAMGRTHSWAEGPGLRHKGNG